MSVREGTLRKPSEEEIRARIKSIEAYLKGAKITYPPQVSWATEKIEVLKYVLGEMEFYHSVTYHNMLEDKRTGVYKAMKKGLLPKEGRR